MQSKWFHQYLLVFLLTSILGSCVPVAVQTPDTPKSLENKQPVVDQCKGVIQFNEEDENRHLFLPDISKNKPSSWVIEVSEVTWIQASVDFNTHKNTLSGESKIVIWSDCNEETKIASGIIETEDDDVPEQSHYGSISQLLQPGRYYIGVKLTNNKPLDVSLNVYKTTAVESKALCKTAPIIVPGKPVKLKFEQNNFNLEFNGFSYRDCDGTHEGDSLHCVELKKESRVRFTQKCNGGCSLFHIGDCSYKSVRDAGCTPPWGTDVEGEYEVTITKRLKAGMHCVVSDSGEYHAKAATTGSLEVQIDTLDGSGTEDDNCEDVPAISNNSIFYLDTFNAKDNFRFYDDEDMTQIIDTANSPDVVRKIEITEKSYLYLDFISKASFDGMIWLSQKCDETVDTIAERFVYNEGNSIKKELDPGTYFLHMDGSSPQQMGEVWLKTEITTVKDFERACKSAQKLKIGKELKGKTKDIDWFHEGRSCNHAHSDTFFNLELKKANKIRFTLEGEGGLVLSVRDKCAWQEKPSKEEMKRSLGYYPGRKPDNIELDLDAGNYIVVINSLSKPVTPFSIKAEIVSNNRKTKNIEEKTEKLTVRILPAFELNAIGDINKELKKQFEDGEYFDVRISDNKKITKINNCKDFHKLPEGDFTMVDHMSLNGLLYQGTRCVALKWMKMAKPASVSLLGSKLLSLDFYAKIPAFMSVLTYNDEVIGKMKESIRACQPWDMFESDFKTISKGEGYFEVTTSQTTATIEVLAIGDFNRDGFEDILIRRVGSPLGGSLVSHSLFLITKTKKNGCFELIKQYH